MCGIAVLVGSGAQRQRADFATMLAAVAPRGEVEETLVDEDALLGTHRLRIVDRDHAVQPWRSADERWALSYNGEVFNFAALRDDLIGEGHPLRSHSDTEVVLEGVLAWGEQALHRFRGEFALALVDRHTGRVFLARDPAGVKPLYWTLVGGRLAVASEVKALAHLGAQVHEVPPGHCGWAETGAAPVLHAYLDLGRLGEDLPMLEDLDEATDLVRRTYREAVRCRVDTDLTVGVVLSGGLDSSLTLLQVRELHPDCVAFTVGTHDSPDLAHARRLADDLGVRHEVVIVRPRDVGLADVREAIRVREASEHGDVINAVVSMRLFEAVRRAGVKVVLTGDGSDELFGGYDMYRRVPSDQARALFLHKIRHLSRTELQRVDRTSMGHGVEARVPYLDPAMLSLATRLPPSMKYRDGYEKWILRHAFADVLPDHIRVRHKHPMSHSSGLHERIRLYQPLFARIHRSFGYDALEPMHRDFWRILQESGHDVTSALAAAEQPRDLTPGEHARDFAGALKWNVIGEARTVRDRLARR
ncbi:asparagine synthase-related protein [soil metagenome]